MKKILIATQNIDKFNIAKELISKSLFPAKIEFCNLKQLNIQHDMVEMGTIEERAAQKAIEFWNYIQRDCLKNEEIILSVGIDDGFGLTEKASGDPNSKVLTDKILSGSYVQEGDNVWLKRGFAIYNNKIKIHSCLTSIPFVFLGNKRNIKREEGKYPLSYVLGLLGQNKTVSEINFHQSIDYYYRYCKNELENLFALLKKY